MDQERIEYDEDRGKYMSKKKKEYEHFYKLKSEYEGKIHKKLRPIIMDKSLNKSEKHQRYRMIVSKIENKKKFLKEDRTLKIVSDGKIITKYNNPYFNLFETSARNFEEWNANNNENMMKLKLDTMFHYKSQDESFKDFENIKKEMKEDLQEYSKILSEIYGLEHMNKEAIQDQKDKLFGNDKKSIKGYVPELKEKLASMEPDCEKEAVEIYQTFIVPCVNEISRLIYYANGYREVVEEGEDEENLTYYLKTEKVSISSREFASEADEEMIAQNQLKRESKKKKDYVKLETDGSLDKNHQIIATLSSELSELMMQYSSLVRKQEDTDEIQDLIQKKMAKLDNERELVKKRQLEKKAMRNAVKIPENLDLYNKQLFINNLSNELRQKYLDGLSREDLLDYIKNLKENGPDKIKINYKKEKISMSESKFKSFIMKHLISSQKIPREEAKKIYMYLKSHDDYYKNHHNYDLFPDEKLSKEDKEALEMKDQLDKESEAKKARQDRENALRFSRDGTIPPWGTADMYIDKINKEDEVYLKSEKVTVYNASGDIWGSEIKSVDDPINHPFSVEATIEWKKSQDEGILPGQDSKQLMIKSKVDKKGIKGWVNYRDVYVDINPNSNGDDLDKAVQLKTPLIEEDKLASSLNDDEEEEESPSFNDWLEEKGYDRLKSISPLKDSSMDDDYNIGD